MTINEISVEILTSCHEIVCVMVPTPLPTLLTMLALKLGVVAKAVTGAGSRLGHGLVNRVVVWIESGVADEVTDKAGNATRVTGLLAKLL